VEAGRLDGATSGFGPDFDSSPPALSGLARDRGHGGLKRFWRDFQVRGDIEIEVDRIIGERSQFTIVGRFRSSADGIPRAAGRHDVLKDGMITRIKLRRR
jgi:hypothetical protein